MEDVRLLGENVCVVVGVAELVQKGAGLQDKSGQYHLAQVHSRSHLLHNTPDQALVLLGQLLYLLSLLLKNKQEFY